MAFIFVLSSMSEPPMPADVSDKLAHTAGYAVLGLLAMRAVAGGAGMPMRVWQALAAVAIAVAYGATDEYHQSFVPGRDADVHDIYADAIGAAIGTAAWWACGILWFRQSQ
jgi:VanZ family protein